MKIFFLLQGTTHYYNSVLNKLDSIDNIKIIDIVPKNRIQIDDGVYQTRNGIKFKTLELEEYKIWGHFLFFKNFLTVLLKERPKIIITDKTYFPALICHVPTFIILKLLGIKFIFKSIPFKLDPYCRRKQLIREQGGNLLRKIKQLCHLQLEKIFYNIPDAHVCYLEEAVDIYGSYGVSKAKIFITYNSPDTDAIFAIKDSLGSLKQILPPNDYRIIHVGRLVAWKKVDLLIKAFAKVKKEYKNAELLIIGYGSKRQELEQLSINFHLEESIKFLGGIYDPGLLGQYLLASSIYVLAGMGGISINEAMCYNLPIICSVCDGTEKKLVRDGFNGLFFRENDEDDLAKKIMYLFANPKLRKWMGNNSEYIIRNEINIHTVIRGYLNAFQYLAKT